MITGIVGENKPAPLQTLDGEAVVMFGTGGQRFIGIGNKSYLLERRKVDFKEVYEIVSMTGMAASALGQPSIVHQSFITYPDITAHGKIPMPMMCVTSLDWYSILDEEQAKVLREHIVKTLKT